MHLNWNTILIAGKFVGVVVSGLAAIAAAMPDKPNRRQKLLPKTLFWRFVKQAFSKQSALQWAGIGLFVALLSQFAETSKSIRDAKESAIQTSNQVQTAMQTLNGIQSMLTHFDEITVEEAYFELPGTNSAVAALATNLDDKLEATEFNNQHVLWSRRSVNHRKATTNFVFYVADIYKPHDKREAWTKVDKLLNSILYSELAIAINRKSQSTEEFATNMEVNGRAGYDLIASRLPGSDKTNVCLDYLLPSRRIFVYWPELKYPKKDWRSNDQVHGLNDVAEGQVGVFFDYPVEDSAFLGLRPQQMYFVFDERRIAVSHFRTVYVSSGRPFFEVQLPPTDAILSGRADIPLEAP